MTDQTTEPVMRQWHGGSGDIRTPYGTGVLIEPKDAAEERNAGRDVAEAYNRQNNHPDQRLDISPALDRRPKP